MWVKNSHVKKGILPSLSPKALCPNLNPCILLPICCLMRQGLPREWLQIQLRLDTMTYLGKQVCSHVPDLIVPDKGKAAMGAGQCMFHTELDTADTCPAIS